MAISKLILNGETQMDVTSNTNTSNNMLSGVVGTKNDGTSVTGNIVSKSSTDLTVSGATVTAPAGYYANAASKAVATVVHPDPTAVLTSSTGMIVAGHIQETGYVTGGTTTTMLSLTTQTAKTVTPTESIQTAVPSYRWTTGNVNVAAISSTYVGTGIPKYSAGDLVASGSGVTVLTGYYSSTVTKLIAAGSAFPPAVTITKAPTIGVNTSGVVTASYNGSSSITPTVTSGYISQGTAGTISTTGTSTYQLTSQAAATYYPSTADQTIASQRWLVGNQTIKSVTTSNLTAANIAEGVTVQVGDANNASRITQVTGTHSGGGGGFTVDDIAMRTISGDISGSATSIGSYAFYYCSSLTTASFPNATHISMHAFAFCSSLTTASFPSATSIGTYAFNSCSALTTASFPNVTSVGNYAFWYCSALTTASFPKATYIGMYAFNCCYLLTTVSFPSATIISNCAFAECYSLTTANFSNVTSIGASAFNYCYLLTTASFPSATIISSSAFNSCYSLTTISFPNVTSIGNNAFYSCSALTTASFPSVTTIGNYAFAYCTSLTTASFPNATSIGAYAFRDCSLLITVNSPSAISIGASAFAACTSLTTVSFPNATYIGASAFRACYHLLSLYLIGSSIPTLGTNAFSYTPIVGYTNYTAGVYGSIFVPSSLYNSYLTATNWSLYSNRIVSV